jgi:hypothetical protein
MLPNEQEIRNYILSINPELPMVEAQCLVMEAKMKLLFSSLTVNEVVDELMK